MNGFLVLGVLAAAAGIALVITAAAKSAGTPRRRSAHSADGGVGSTWFGGSDGGGWFGGGDGGCSGGDGGGGGGGGDGGGC